MVKKKSTKKSSRPKVASSAINALFESLEEAKRIAASFGKTKKRKPKTSALFESIEEAKKIARLFVGGGSKTKAKKATSQARKSKNKLGKASNASSKSRKASNKNSQSQAKRSPKKTTKQTSVPNRSKSGARNKQGGSTSKNPPSKKSTPARIKSIEDILDTSNYKTYNAWARAVMKNADRVDRELPKGHRFVAKYMDGTTMSTTEKISFLIDRLNSYEMSKDYGKADRREEENAEDLLESIHVYEVPDRWAHMREVREQRAEHKVRRDKVIKEMGKSLGTKAGNRRKSGTDLMEDAMKRIKELEAQLGGKKNATKRKTK